MTDTPSSQNERRQAEADIVSRHLPSGYTAEPDAVSNAPSNKSASASASNLPSSAEEPQDSLTLQGGDIHREIFKIGARARLPARAATFAHPQPHRSSTFGLSKNDIIPSGHRAPSGFRRQVLQRRFNSYASPVTRDIVSFLDLYGNFAGENLEESEDESALDSTDDEAEAQTSETRPLLSRRKSSRRAERRGEATTLKSFFTLLKAFIGTGIMFLPKAFRNGGILFSSITLVTVSLISCLSFHLLLLCRQRYGGGYGELGAAIGGPRLRALILFSITISQIGFVCAGIIFTAENLASFLDAVTSSPTAPLSGKALIAVQLVVLIPLALIRNISRLQTGPRGSPSGCVHSVRLGLHLVLRHRHTRFTRHPSNSRAVQPLRFHPYNRLCDIHIRRHRPASTNPILNGATGEILPPSLHRHVHHHHHLHLHRRPLLRHLRRPHPRRSHIKLPPGQQIGQRGPIPLLHGRPRRHARATLPRRPHHRKFPLRRKSIGETLLGHQVEKERLPCRDYGSLRPHFDCRRERSGQVRRAYWKLCVRAACVYLSGAAAL